MPGMQILYLLIAAAVLAAVWTGHGLLVGLALVVGFVAVMAAKKLSKTSGSKRQTDAEKR